jgi:outer membrane protein
LREAMPFSKLGWLVIGSIYCFGTAPAQSRELNLREAVAFAVENSPLIKGAKASRAIAHLSTKNALSGFFPSIDLSLNGGVQQYQPPNSTDPFKSGFNLTLKENLYDNGVSITKHEIAQVEGESADLSLKRAIEKVSLDVVTEYYQFSFFSKMLEVKRDQFEILRKHFELVDGQYRQGFKTKKDVLRLEAQVRRAEIERSQAESNLENSVSHLKSLLGVQMRISVENLAFKPLEPSASKISFPTSSIALEKTLDFGIAALAKEASRLNAKFADREYWPRLNFVLTGSYDSKNFYGPLTPYSGTGFAPLTTPSGLVNGTEQWGWSAMVTIEYNLWDWGIRKRNIEIAESGRQLSDAKVQLQLESTASELEINTLRMNRLRSILNQQQSLLDQQVNAYDLLKNDYREGKVPYIDLITTLNDLFAAKTGFFSTYFDAMRVIANYYYYEGKLYEMVLRD